MQKLVFYATLAVCLFVNKINAQETFEQRARKIAQNIEAITSEEKEALKAEIETLNKQLQEGKISQADADQAKIDYASKHAKNIEQRIAIENDKMNTLIQDKVDGRIKLQDTTKRKFGTSIVLGGESDEIRENQDQIDVFAFKKYKGNKDYIEKKSKRTTSQFVFAAGLNNVITENENFKKSDFRVWGSHYYEWGLTYNTRIFKNNNLLHAKYGFSFMYNNLRPTENRYFVKNNDKTVLATAINPLSETRFKMVNLVFPMHLEFDFTPKKVKDDGSTYFRTHKSGRIGIGGFAGFNIKNKQIIKYESNNNDFKLKEKGSFNTNDFVYGLSAYVGYKETSFYVKYDMNDIFKNNPVSQNNISMGVRFDFN